MQENKYTVTGWTSVDGIITPLHTEIVGNFNSIEELQAVARQELHKIRKIVNPDTIQNIALWEKNAANTFNLIYPKPKDWEK